MSPKRLGSRQEVSVLTETRDTLSVDIVRVEFNLNYLPNNAVHVSGFLGEDGRIAVCLIDIVFSYGGIVRMF
jgi:hypothetical protein